MTYKLIGTKPNESPDAAIIRCANNLVKAVIASGRSIHSTSDCNHFDLYFFRCDGGKTIRVSNCLSGWQIDGKSAIRVTFEPEEPENDLTQDDAGEGRKG